MTPDAATLTYVSLNAFAAIFDNCYMALYTALGPEQFWHTSRVFNDADFHLRLVKGTTGSLTVALLIFISTLGWRRQMSMDVAIWLNAQILGSVGPWIVLFWHKLVDPSETGSRSSCSTRRSTTTRCGRRRARSRTASESTRSPCRPFVRVPGDSPRLSIRVFSPNERL